MNNLDSYRRARENWQDLAYCEGESEERGSFDTNEKARYAILIALQYDFQESDRDLIVFLLEQEIIARENDDFQGIGESLRLGSYLLAKFKNPTDIPLFYRAKFANFDTGCGFDREFMFLALKENTEEYILDNYPELYDKNQGNYTGDYLARNLDDWWNNLSKEYPDCEKNESPLTLYERNIYFGNNEIAKKYLETWKNLEPDSSDKEVTLKHAYTKMGEFSRAVEFVKRELTEKKTNWDRASTNLNLLELYTQMGGDSEGFNVVLAIDKEFNQFNDWKRVGLGRMAVHEAFKYSIASNDLSISRSVFQIAHKWFEQMDNIAFVGLEAGWKAAKKCSFSAELMLYKNLADKESE
jgi:hypothetical protein